MQRETSFALVVATATCAATAIGAQIALELPGSAVPVTLQSFTAIFAGFAAGRMLPGVLGMAAYLGLAALGLPVLAGGAGGLEVMTGKSAGYLAGLLVAPAIAWGVAEWFRGLPRVVGVAIGAGVAHLAILATGVAWLITQLDLSPQIAIDAGALPYLSGGLMKTGAIAIVAAATGR